MYSLIDIGPHSTRHEIVQNCRTQPFGRLLWLGFGKIGPKLVFLRWFCTG